MIIFILIIDSGQTSHTRTTAELQHTSQNAHRKVLLWLLPPMASHQVMPKQDGKCVCMPCHVTIISWGAVVLLRGLTTAHNSTRLTIKRYQPFQGYFFFLLNDAVRISFQQGFFCHSFRDTAPLKGTAGHQRCKPLSSRTAVGAAPAVQDQKKTLQREKPLTFPS